MAQDLCHDFDMQITDSIPARASDRRFRLAIVLAVVAAVWLNAAILLPWARLSAPVIGLLAVGGVTAALQWRLDALADYAFLVFIFLAVSVAYLVGADADSILLFESIALLVATTGLLVMSIPERRVLKAFAVFAVFVSGFMMAKYAELTLENSQTIQVLWFALVALAGVLTKSLRERRLHARLAYLESMLMRDALTGLLNQQSAYAAIEAIFPVASTAQLPVAIAVIDLDGFKEVNDTLGHDVGNILLREVAACIAQDASGPHDVAARIGGDEFLISWHGLSVSESALRAEALREKIRHLRLAQGARDPVIDASIGVVVREPASVEPIADLVRRADQAMYVIKRSRAGTPVRGA